MKVNGNVNRPRLIRPGTDYLRWIALGLLTIPATGCSNSPEFNILGSYFPSWLVCLAVAIVLVFVVHFFVARKEWANELWPLPIVYSALVCFFSCTFWLIFFE